MRTHPRRQQLELCRSRHARLLEGRFAADALSMRLGINDLAPGYSGSRVRKKRGICTRSRTGNAIANQAVRFKYDVEFAPSAVGRRGEPAHSLGTACIVALMAGIGCAAGGHRYARTLGARGPGSSGGQLPCGGASHIGEAAPPAAELEVLRGINLSRAPRGAPDDPSPRKGTRSGARRVCTPLGNTGQGVAMWFESAVAHRLQSLLARPDRLLPSHSLA